MNNLSDQAGNPLPANSSLSFSIFDQYTNGDVVINEFMYDEPAGQAEYIEIRNLTSKRFDISNWQLGDSNEPQSISSDSLILEGDAFLVLTADSTNLFNSYGNRNYWEIKNFPTLNNSSGDQIRIHTGAGIVVDSLFYDPSWGGEDRALERRLATAPSVYRENWGNSPNKSGGHRGWRMKLRKIPLHHT
ncbi:MAG: lamin tail domain-containing protein [Balneolaceae bacterium]|nr:lamin tail domain-containing protein [Balneolaceae bacterium]